MFAIDLNVCNYTIFVNELHFLLLKFVNNINCKHHNCLDRFTACILHHQPRQFYEMWKQVIDISYHGNRIYVFIIIWKHGRGVQLLSSEVF